ncbi:MAG: hypothetical protein JRF22_07470, partial [Deltaproteobacteria bacterium]|nr:hypothetical protein [Deltaproteobacteria bacterium]
MEAVSDNSVQTFMDEVGASPHQYPYEAFIYSTYALKEATLRFPEYQNVSAWELRTAYNLTRALEISAAGNLYSTIIENALNSGETTLDQLAAWVHLHEPALVLELEEVNSPSWWGSSVIATIGEPYRYVNTFLWVNGDPGNYHVFNLRPEENLFSPQTITYALADITGDTLDEIIFEEVEERD